MKTVSTFTNPKLLKAFELFRDVSACLMLAPWKLANKRRNLCPNASQGCIETCLNTAGRGAMDGTQDARINRTLRFFGDPKAFFLSMYHDIEALQRKAVRLEGKASYRPNGTSDLAWEKLLPEMFIRFADVQFFDYTKDFTRMADFLSGSYGAGRVWPVNYYLTFSWSGENAPECKTILKHGGNVAVPFAVKKGDPLPQFFLGHPVIDGDEHDSRFRDPRGVVVGLRAKGRAKLDQTGFVVR